MSLVERAHDDKLNPFMIINNPPTLTQYYFNFFLLENKKYFRHRRNRRQIWFSLVKFPTWCRQTANSGTGSCQIAAIQASLPLLSLPTAPPMVRTRLFSLWQKIRFQAWPIEGPLLDKLTASLGLQVQDWLRFYLGVGGD